MKFNFRQFLFEVFFDITGIFCSVPPQSKPTFPFQYILIFILKMANVFRPLTPFLKGNKNKRPMIFLLKIQFIQFLFEVFFNIIGIFS